MKLHEEYSKMVTDLAKPGYDIVTSMNAVDAHNLHMAVGISGEVGELIKAWVNGDKGNAIEELGDIEFYLEGLRQGMSIRRKDLFKYPAMSTYEVPETGLVVYAAHILDSIKKVVIYKKEIEIHLIMSQLVTMEHYLMEVRTEHDLSRDIILDYNMKKLLKGKDARYKEGTYSDKAAQDRSDKA